MSEERKLSSQSLALGGFAFQAAWVFVVFWKPLQSSWGIAEGTDLAGMVLSFTNGTVLCVAYLLYGLFWKRIQACTESLSWILAAGFLMTAGSLAQALAPLPAAGRVVISAITYASSAFLLISWLRVFSGYDSDTVLKTIPSIIAAIALVCVLVSALIPYSRTLLLIALPVLSLGLLALERRHAVPAPESQRPLRPNRLLRVCLFTLLVSFMVGGLCGYGRYIDKSVEASHFYLYFLFMIAGILLILAITTFYRDYLVTPKSVQEFPSFIAPALVVGFASAWLGLLFHVDMNLFGNAFGRCCLELALVVMFCIVAQHYKSSAVQVFSFGQATFLVGGLPGTYSLLKLLGLEDIPLGNIGVIILLLACTSLLVFGLVFVIINRDFMNIVNSSPDTEPEEPATAEDPAASAAAAVGALTQRYGLSDREREVLEEFARGRSMKRIAEDLCVSVGTVNTYLRRIYQKMDIHSRQELLDRFDEAREQCRQGTTL